MCQELDPRREVAVHSAAELRLGSVPLLCRLERDVWCCVVDHRERRHPEVVAEPWHEPVLDQAPPASVDHECRQHRSHERKHGRQRHQHAGPLLLRVLGQVKVPDEPVAHGRKQLHRGAQEELEQGGCQRAPVLHLLLLDRHPSSVLLQLVGVRVVVVVLDAPRLEGVDQRSKHQGANNVLNQVVLVERAVASIMANHKEPGECSAGQRPRKWQQVPRRDVDQVQAGRHRGDAGQNRTPGLPVVNLEHLLGHRLNDGVQGHVIGQLLANLQVAHLLGQGRTLLVAHEASLRGRVRNRGRSSAHLHCATLGTDSGDTSLGLGGGRAHPQAAELGHGHGHGG
mmetsp:Transcript_52145/g.113747  ORF Transcript_52145/g.113747 Transcript_52145/m.113747 type:complete len:340 (+) Transcript_52145:440-1459(+)